MRALVLAVPVALAAAGCHKPPPEAPKELNDVNFFLFSHFEDEDPAELGAGLVNLRALVKDTDLSADVSERAVTLEKISGDDLGGLAIPEGADAEKQIPIGLGGESVHDLDAQLKLVYEKNQVCIESETTKWAERTMGEGADCFRDGSCDRLSVSQEVRKENLLAKVWYDQFKDYRWVDAEDPETGDVTRVLLARSWIEEVFPTDGGNGSWDQLFQLDVSWEDGSKTLRWFAMWSSITVGGIGDDLYATSVRDGIAEAFVYGDEFISGDIQECTNDRAAEKPPRE